MKAGTMSEPLIKTEDTDNEANLAQQLQSTSPADEAAHPTPSPPLDQWNQQDELSTYLFRPWDELPRSHVQPWTPEQEWRVANNLEQLIPFFDTYINHSDEGLLAFVARHQRAMNAGWTDVLPAYSTTSIQPERRWATDKWLSRYANLAKTRQKIVEHRLRMNLGVTGVRLERF